MHKKWTFINEFFGAHGYTKELDEATERESEAAQFSPPSVPPDTSFVTDRGGGSAVAAVAAGREERREKKNEPKSGERERERERD